ncbi:MAG TPA: MarR family winged helix-turn-helix transcriptional regulator [Ktedonobacteraceae bacterium]|jgi:DNA-binding MarR family transcriptional regulator|nr:MarR family winged helix-turn-helix transcriptional regulator [Ktedonobacteraceae bacterium]
MSDAIIYEQEQSTINEQVERFTTIFTDLRKVMGAGFKHAHQHGLSTTQFIMLGLIGKAQSTGEACTISSIAADLGIDPATVVRTVDSLEKRGLVERRRSREDRRQVFVEFTDAGRAARQESHQQFINRIQTILLAMSEEGRSSLLHGLEEFVRVGLRAQEIHSDGGSTETC